MVSLIPSPITKHGIMFGTPGFRGSATPLIVLRGCPSCHPAAPSLDLRVCLAGDHINHCPNGAFQPARRRRRRRRPDVLTQASVSRDAPGVWRSADLTSKYLPAYLRPVGGSGGPRLNSDGCLGTSAHSKRSALQGWTRDGVIDETAQCQFICALERRMLEQICVCTR